MKIPEPTTGRRIAKGFKDAEIERAADAKGTRETIREPWLQGPNLYATDSYVGVRIPVVRDENDVDGPVPAAALKAARKIKFLPELRRIALNNSSAVVDGPDGQASFRRAQDIEPPNFEQLIPVGLHGVTIGVDVEKIYQAARALGSQDVRLTIQVDGDGAARTLKPVVLEPINRDDNRVALIMPVALV